MSDTRYNLIIIGGGSAGMTAAMTAASYNAKVALIEKSNPGGRCLHAGFVPLRHLNHMAYLLKHLENSHAFGLKDIKTSVDFRNLMERMLDTRDVFAAALSHDNLRQRGIDMYLGEATVLSPHSVKVNDEVLSAKKLIIATGAFPVIPAIKGLDQTDYFHRDNVWELTERPKSLLVIGGGRAGCEMAQLFSRLGSTVTMLFKESELLPEEDDMVNEHLKSVFLQEGITLKSDSEPVSVNIHKGMKEMKFISSGKEDSVTANHILFATGLTPKTLGFGLEHLGLNMEKNGLIPTDAWGQTNIESVYACGDCTRDGVNEFRAMNEGYVCAFNALFRPLRKKKIDRQYTPEAMFTDPEIIRCGLNEREASELNVKFRTFTLPLVRPEISGSDALNHKAWVLVLTSKFSDRILGVTLVGSRAAEMMPEFMLAMKNGLGLKAVMHNLHIAPTLNEFNPYGGSDWRLLTRSVIGSYVLKWFHGFRRK